MKFLINCFLTGKWADAISDLVFFPAFQFFVVFTGNNRMTYIQQILQQYPDAGYWHQQYPYFATGQLIHSANQKNAADALETVQKSALFFNDMVRLHWLLYQKEYIPARVGRDHDQSSIIAAPTISVDLAAFVHSSETLSEHPEEAGEEADQSIEAAEQDITRENIFSRSLADAAKTLKENVGSEDDLAIQAAYQHTIDYFASQGIKLDSEPELDDRFGHQLKTFTSWLRQMKPLPDLQVATADPLVETFAAHSLQQEDVLTEPMADILLKQGKKAQAIDVLGKLRLLHPKKSLYFAARIEQIKHS